MRLLRVRYRLLRSIIIGMNKVILRTVYVKATN